MKSRALCKVLFPAFIAVGLAQDVRSEEVASDLGELIAEHFSENANPIYDGNLRAYFGICPSPVFNSPEDVFASVVTPGVVSDSGSFIGFRGFGEVKYPIVMVNSSDAAAQFDATSGEVQSGEIFLHPDNSDGVTIVFMPTIRGAYRFDFQIRSIESGGDGVYVEVLDSAGTNLYASGSTKNSDLSGSFCPGILQSGSPCFIRINKGSHYSCDSSAFRLSVTRCGEGEYFLGDELDNLTGMVNSNYRADASEFSLSSRFAVEFCALTASGVTTLDKNVYASNYDSLSGRGLSTGLYYTYPRILTNQGGDDFDYYGSKIRADEICVHPSLNHGSSYLRFKVLQPIDKRCFLVVNARDVLHDSKGGVDVELYVNDVLASHAVLVDVAGVGLLQRIFTSMLLPKLEAGDTFGVNVRTYGSALGDDDTVLRISLNDAMRMYSNGMVIFYR